MKPTLAFDNLVLSTPESELFGTANVKSQHFTDFSNEHSKAERDTSLAIPLILATILENKGYDVDFALPWGQGHGGDYDLDELFNWIERISVK